MLRSTLLSALAIGLVITFADGAQADLVANGNFVTGDFTGWVISGDGIGIDSTFANAAAGDTNDAFFSAAPGDPSPGTLSQTIATTSGTGYDLGFALVDEAGFSGDSFTVGFGGFSATITGDQASPYQDGVDLYTAESFVIPGADIPGSSTSLSFQGLNAAGADWNLDDVSLAAGPSAPVPEPSSLTLFLGALVLGLGLRRFGLGRQRA